MTEKQVIETVNNYIKDKEADLMLKAQAITLEIKVLSDPFTDPQHPAQFVLHDYLHTHAEIGDFSLIERVNSLVDDLTEQRADLLMQVDTIRRNRK